MEGTAEGATLWNEPVTRWERKAEWTGQDWRQQERGLDNSTEENVKDQAGDKNCYQELQILISEQI